MGNTVGYALREEFKGTVTQVIDGEEREVPVYSGGVIAAGDGDINVAEELENGDGVIVVEDTDPRITTALDGYPALKRVEVPEGARPVAGSYADVNATDLRRELTARGIRGAGNLSKADAVAALEAFDAREDAVPDGTHVDELLSGAATPPAGDEGGDAGTADAPEGADTDDTNEEG